MNYTGCVNGRETELAVLAEGLRMGSRFLDYADVVSLRPINFRVMIDTSVCGQIEISMLGRSFDGFWEELTRLYGVRSLESLFVDEEQIMLCEGEYALLQEKGRGLIALYPDAVCILPPTWRAVRIPLCFTQEILLDGYQICLRLRDGQEFFVGKMGYDTMPFYERTLRAADNTKAKRQAAWQNIPLHAPFTVKGLFRTEEPQQYWNAAFGSGVCAVELFAGEDAATYLYRFREPRERFLQTLEQAMEAMGTHREIIYLTDEQLSQKPLYRMSVDRTKAAGFLRARSDGRLIHNARHGQRLEEYLGGGEPAR